MSRLERYRGLSPPGRKIVWQSLILLPAAAMLVAMCGLASTTPIFRRLRAPRQDSALSPTEAARVVSAVATLLRVGCLPKAVVLCHVLRNCGKRLEIRLGVAPPAGALLSAHAWVELDGIPLNESAHVLERYHALPPLAG